MRKGVKFLLTRGAGGLFWSPGLRKTSVTLAAIKLLRDEIRGAPWLIIAPVRVCHLVWPKEIQKWQDFQDLSVEVLHGPDKNAALRRKADVYCINPEGLPWLLEQWRQGNMPKFFGLVVDESTAFKKSNTERFKNLKGMLNMFKRRYILTGSPAPNGLLDLFGQIFILDRGAALGEYITKYRLEFFDPTGYGGYTWVPKPGAKVRIYERISELVLRFEDKDYLELPPLIGAIGQKEPPNIIEVELPKVARKIYDDLEEHLIADIGERVIVAANVGVAITKCAQVANGGLYSNESRTAWKLMHDAKTDAAEEFVDERNGDPTLIAVDYHHDAERLIKRFGKDTPYLGKGVSVKEAKRIESAWNAGDLRVLLMSVATPHGLNMQERGRAVLYHSITYNWEHYDQFFRRVYRSGVGGSIIIGHLSARGTVDEAKIAALQSKHKGEEAMLDALKAYAVQRGYAPKPKPYGGRYSWRRA